MAICKRPAAAVAMGGQPVKKRRRVVVAKRTWPGPGAAKKLAVAAIKSPGAYASKADYEETSFVGEGAFGVVYMARHRATGQTVAIKSLPSLLPEVATYAREQLLREARLHEAATACGGSGNPHVVHNPLGSASSPSTPTGLGGCARCRAPAT
jgi:cell division cycle 2-like protein